MSNQKVDTEPKSFGELRDKRIEAALVKQGGHCAFCPTPIDGTPYRLVGFDFDDLAPDGQIVPEDEVTGKVYCCDRECQDRIGQEFGEEAEYEVRVAEFDAWMEVLAASLTFDHGRSVPRDFEERRANDINENGGTARDIGWLGGYLVFYKDHTKDMQASVKWDTLQDHLDYIAGYGEWSGIIQYGSGHGHIRVRSVGDGRYRVRTFMEPVETFPEAQS